jgi:hypothetical protein
MAGRRKKPSDTPLDETPVLMLPAPRTHKHGERDKDPYVAPAGAVPGRATNMKVVGSKPLDRALTDKEREQQIALQGEMAAKADRYHRWLEALIITGGERAQALVHMKECASIEEAEERAYVLEMEIRQGQTVSDIGDILMRHDLTAEMQVMNIKRWLLSDNAAASINAQKLLQELAGDSHQEGSFEQLIRIHNARKQMTA